MTWQSEPSGPTQLDAIRELMLAATARGDWLTLAEIAGVTEYGEASISAQLRHLRKRQFGSYRVEKRRRLVLLSDGVGAGNPAARARGDGRASLAAEAGEAPWEYSVYAPLGLRHNDGDGDRCGSGGGDGPPAAPAAPAAWAAAEAEADGEGSIDAAHESASRAADELRSVRPALPLAISFEWAFDAVARSPAETAAPAEPFASASALASSGSGGPAERPAAVGAAIGNGEVRDR